jgi:Zn-dependent alcohol dehydrogenase
MQVLVKNEFAGINFIDTYHRSGLYKRDLPFVGGQEGAGVIAQVTPKVLIMYMCMCIYQQNDEHCARGQERVPVYRSRWISCVHVCMCTNEYDEMNMLVE